MMLMIIQLCLLITIGFIGIICNWLLILAIQRKTYHYQYSHRIPSPTTNKSLLQPYSSVSGQVVQPPLLPSARSSVSIFDKFILAFLINDIFVCNFLLPLRLIDLFQGLPCAFLCFVFKLIEKLTTTIELIIINLLLISSLVFFWKKRLLTTKLWFIMILFMLPFIISCLITTLIYVDVDEEQYKNRPQTCKQTYVYISKTTQKTLNIFCCLMTYIFIFINFILLFKTKSSIKVYKKNSLKSLTEAALSARPEASLSEQSITENSNRRRSMYYAASITLEPSHSTSTQPLQRSIQPIDYLSYLTVMENSHTLIRSTFVILLIYFLFYIPYWLYEFSNNQFLYELKDLFFLCHIIKPFCYLTTNEKYRHHVWAIIQCRTFRMLPTILRRKSRVVTLNNNRNSFTMSNNY